MIRALCSPLRWLQSCSCGGWVDPSDPDSWTQHKRCR